MAFQESCRIATDVRPKATHETVKQLVLDNYGLTVVHVKTMVAYDDQNFHILVEPIMEGNRHISDVHTSGYVVKILNSDDSKYRLVNLNAQIKMMNHLNNNGIVCPVHVKNKTGEFYSLVGISSGDDGVVSSVSQLHALRVLKYIEGDILDSYRPITPLISHAGGRFVGQIRRALEGYQDHELERDDCQWNVLNVLWVRDYVKYVESEENRATAIQALDLWDKMWPVISKMERVPIHNDVNSTNTIVEPKENMDDVSAPRIIGVIDFGESCLAPRIFDLAFHIMYMMTDAKKDYLEVGKRAVQGYTEIMSITESEKSILYYVIIARFTLSMVYGAYYYAIHKDPYLLLTQTGWQPLRMLLDESPEQLMERWLPSSS